MTRTGPGRELIPILGIPSCPLFPAVLEEEWSKGRENTILLCWSKPCSLIPPSAAGIPILLHTEGHLRFPSENSAFSRGKHHGGSRHWQENEGRKFSSCLTRMPDQGLPSTQRSCSKRTLPHGSPPSADLCPSPAHSFPQPHAPQPTNVLSLGEPFLLVCPPAGSHPSLICRSYLTQGVRRGLVHVCAAFPR